MSEFDKPEGYVVRQMTQAEHDLVKRLHELKRKVATATDDQLKQVSAILDEADKLFEK